MNRRISDVTAAAKAIKEAVDIVKVVQADLGEPRSQSGHNTWWWCPFHSEKDRPSFAVHSIMQIFKCFGCQEAGDVLSWMQKHRGMSFIEAIQYLATEFGVDISAYTREPTPDEMARDRFMALCNTAAGYCHSLLVGNKEILDWYLEDTGFSLWQVEEYQVGYSPSSRAIVEFLHSKHSITENEVRKLEFHRQDMWNHSLVYPIHDPSGAVRRFYAKPLGGGGSGKYLSTSHNHPLFDPGLLYGLHVARRHMRQGGRDQRLIIVEGQKACIASGGASVATMGAKITPDQIKTLRRLKLDRVTFCFDSDVAGYKASLGLLDEAQEWAGIDVKVAKLPLEYPQVDELIKANGRPTYDAVIAAAVSPIEFWVDTQYDLDRMDVQAKIDMVKRLRGYFAAIPRLEVEVLAGYLSEVLGVPRDAVVDHIDEVRASGATMANPEAEASLIHYLVTTPAAVASARKLQIQPDHFTVPKYAQVFRGAMGAYDRHGTKFTLQTVIEEIEQLYPTGKDAQEAARQLALDEPKHKLEPALDIVTDLWRRRHTAHRATALISSMRDLSVPTLDVVQEFRRTMVSMVDKRQDQATSPEEVAESAMRIFHERAARGGGIIGFDFSTLLDVDGRNVGGFPVLNALASGLQKGRMTVLGGHQGTGKSLLALNIAATIGVNQRVPTLWIAQEMQADEQAFRLASILSGVSNTKIQRAMLDSEEEYKRFERAMEMIHDSELHIVTPRVGSADEIFAIIDDYKFRHGIEVVIWDYIQLVESGPGTRGMARHEVIAQAAQMFKHRVSTGLDVAAVAVAQVNRGNVRPGEAPTGEDMGGSYKISQDADNIYLIGKKTAEQIEEFGAGRGNRVINVSKQRGGVAEVLLDANLDTTLSTLRFTEAIAPQDAAAILTGSI